MEAGGHRAARGRRLRLTYETPSGPVEVATRAVILTTPAYVAGDLLRAAAPAASAALGKFYYPPVCACTLAYPLSAVREDRLKDGALPGFGQLHPRTQASGVFLAGFMARVFLYFT